MLRGASFLFLVLPSASALLLATARLSPRAIAQPSRAAGVFCQAEEPEVAEVPEVSDEVLREREPLPLEPKLCANRPHAFLRVAQNALGSSSARATRFVLYASCCTQFLASPALLASAPPS